MTDLTFGVYTTDPTTSRIRLDGGLDAELVVRALFVSLEV
jgi:hypothetical protein